VTRERGSGPSEGGVGRRAAATTSGTPYKHTAPVIIPEAGRGNEKLELGCDGEEPCAWLMGHDNSRYCIYIHTCTYHRRGFGLVKIRRGTAARAVTKPCSCFLFYLTLPDLTCNCEPAHLFPPRPQEFLSLNTVPIGVLATFTIKLPATQVQSGARWEILIFGPNRLPAFWHLFQAEARILSWIPGSALLRSLTNTVPNFLPCPQGKHSVCTPV